MSDELVVIHGAGLGVRPVLEHFGGTRRLLTPRLPDTPGIDAAVAAITGCIRDAGDGPMDVVGESVGAVVAAATAARHPELVGRLVLVGGWTHPMGPRDRFAADFWLDLLAADRELACRFAVLLGFSPPVLDALGDSGLVRALAEQDWPRHVEFVAELDIRGLLPRIVAPTLVIGFAEDHLVSVDGARSLHAGISGSRYVELGGGHYDWLTCPDRLLALVEAHTSQVRA